MNRIINTKRKNSSDEVEVIWCGKTCRASLYIFYLLVKVGNNYEDFQLRNEGIVKFLFRG